MRRYLLLSAALWLLSTMLMGCGGGGSGSPGNSLSGTITANSFDIPAGETRTATGDLTIDTTNGITISGTLLIQPGVSVYLLSHGPITISGVIDEAPTKSARGTRDTPNDPVLLIGSPDVNISGIASTCRGGNIYILVETPDMKVEISGKVAAKNGWNSDSPSVKARDGGSVEIGTTAGLDLAKQKGYTFAAVPKRVVLGILCAGDGGHGFNDTRGKVTDTTLYLKCSAGGNGGDVRVAATEAIEFLDQASVLPGSGGRGGQVGNVDAAAEARSGTEPGEAGYNVNAISGSGGNGGSVVYTAPSLVGTAVGKGGWAGYAGEIYVKAGDGGPGGNGGNVTLVVGKGGAPGTGPQPNPGTNNKPAVFVFGANGGNSRSVSMSGGLGGQIKITGPDSAPAVAKVTFSIACNGGRGAIGSATVTGTDGGNAGRLAVKIIDYELLSSFRGGDGGDGHPPGAGGDCGRDELNGQIGTYGNPGKLLGLG